MNIEINKNELFSRLFKIELSDVSEEIQNLWKFYDVYVEMIDDFSEYRKVKASNDSIVSQIKEALKA